MSTAGISFGGLASGLDTKAIIAALMAVERRPISALEQKKTAIGKQKTLFGDLRGLLDKLQDAAKALKTTTDFLVMQASSDDETVLTASAGPTATPGSHVIMVHSLATAQVNASLGQADLGTDYGDGTLGITIDGVEHFVSVGPGTGFAGTIDGIAQAINAQGIDVAADVVDTGQTGANRYQLVLRSRTTGADGAFTLALDSGTPAMQALVGEINGNPLVPAANAHIEMNGVHVYRSSNSIADVITGVTLDLRSVGTEPVSVTIATDAAATSAKVQEFVDAYNAIVDFVKTQNQLGEKGTASSPLFGDVTLRSLRSSLRSIVGESIGTGNQAYSLLSQVGITADRDGRLAFNESRFGEALVADEQAVAAMFTAPGAGIARLVDERIDVYTDSVDGLLKARNDGFERLIKDADRRIEQAEGRLERYQAQLERRFANLESMLAQLQGQGSALSSLPMMSPNSNR